MLPQHLIVRFWADVKERLERDYGLDEKTAQQYISTYCERMQTHGGVDMIYHENPADVALALSHGGIMVPEPSREERRRELIKFHPEMAELLVDEEN
ncbi:MAG TPA: hypothetical protein PK867_24565 [Pirellulales bacterium]|nr:hypothetical protein [Pirellulales bacterium]